MSAHLLIVDDEAMIRNMQATNLGRQGYLCHQAANADEASLILARQSIDLALIDINMPGRSGVQLLQELKKTSPDTAALMVSAVDDLDTAMFCLKLGADDYILKPFSIERMELSVHNALEKRRLVLENRVYQRDLEAKVLNQTEQIRTTLANLHCAYEDTLTALARALDAREKEVGAHSERVSNYTLYLARAMGVAEPLLSDMAKGALLHDIGKIGISDNILLKPARLDEAEWAEMRRHPQLGFEIIAGVKFLKGAAQLVLTHHERYDGGGYPQGLVGEAIPLGARIFALADTLDAMTSDRPYRLALPFEMVLAEVDKHCGTQFDPEVAKVFLATPRRVWEDLAGRRL